MTEIEEAAIGWAVTQLIHHATALGDAGRWDELGALYTEDAVLIRPSAPDAPIVGRAAILASMQARAPRTQRHVLSNPVVTIVSADEVHVTSTLTLFTGAPAAAAGDAAPADAVVHIGQFDDVVVRSGQAWRFARRGGSMVLRYGAPA